MDEYGFIHVNTNRFFFSNEPYILTFTNTIAVQSGGPIRKWLAYSYRNAPHDLYNMSEKDLEADNDVICGQNKAHNIREDKFIT